MSAVRASPYLLFADGCEAALSSYAAHGLGRVTSLVRHGEGGLPLPNPAMRGKVAHALFEGPGIMLFASDNDDAEPMRGHAMLLEFGDAGRARAVFDGLAEGGRVTTAFEKQPWGDLYGKLVDAFGVQWMVKCGAPPEVQLTGAI
ncbi:Glyoxalase/Bleomycin resistance protein/Dihydroxybiphenyl dioxygenase [Hyaloraphidium curvatum]|nr:Glyoxalase/Bleomycin resistance protein/Dihydroxybiphenyl dioxygenase [Hyaloraphidium curvatum]